MTIRYDIMRVKDNSGKAHTMRVSHDGDYVADFRMSPKGFAAFAYFMTGLARDAGVRPALYDADNSRYLIGDIQQLLES